MSVRMRHTKGHTRNRRSHHALKSPRLSACNECGAMHLRHRICDNCGKYRARVVIDKEAEIAKKAARVKRKRRELGLEDKPATEKE
jgi:large subunit ribosomal protein L32